LLFSCDIMYTVYHISREGKPKMSDELETIGNFASTPVPAVPEVVTPEPIVPVATTEPSLEERLVAVETTLTVIVPAFAKLLSDLKSFNIFAVLSDIPQLTADFRAVEAAVKGV
jgi:hypothetical protein